MASNRDNIYIRYVAWANRQSMGVQILSGSFLFGGVFAFMTMFALGVVGALWIWLLVWLSTAMASYLYNVVYLDRRGRE